MKSGFFIFLGVVVFFLPNFVFAEDHSDFTVKRFHVDLAISDEGTLLVHETILVDFSKEKHGLFRYVPVVYRINDTTEAMTSIIFHDVTDRKGEGVNYVTTNEYSDFVIRIGNAGETVIGLHEYNIVYEVEGVFMYFNDHDELFWNVTGNDWPVELGKVTTTIHFPPGAFLEGSACYTGEFGSEETDCKIIDLGTRVRIEAEDYLTIAIGFTPNIIVEVLPTIIDQEEIARRDAENLAAYKTIYRERMFYSNLFWLAPILAIFLFRIFARLFCRSKKKRGAIVAEFKAPDNLRPTEMGVLMDGKMHRHDIAAFIVDMAVRGYLEIIEEGEGRKKSFKVRKLKEADSDLRDWESGFFKGIFGKDKEALEKDIGRRLGYIYTINSKKIADRLVEDGYLKRAPQNTDGVIFVIAIFMMFPIFVVGLFSSIELKNPIPLIAMSLAAVLVPILRPRIVQFTKKGAEAKAHIDGFKLFLKTAEKYRLEWQEDEHIFEEMLPYAMTFKIADKWSKVFDDFYREKGENMIQPVWYSGSKINNFNPALIATGVGVMTKKMSVSMKSYSSGGSSYKYPGSSSYGGSSGSSGISSSSSGGSGSSGGGFGGGGGGSW